MVLIQRKHLNTHSHRLCRVLIHYFCYSCWYNYLADFALARGYGCLSGFWLLSPIFTILLKIRNVNQSLVVDILIPTVLQRLVKSNECLTWTLKLGFHYPSWRVTGFHYPSTRAVNSASGNARPSTRPGLQTAALSDLFSCAVRVLIFLLYA